MVDITERLEKIREMIRNGDYFCINRGRQYGKTTTLSMLKKYLEPECLVFSLSFEGLGDKDCQSVERFLSVFVKMLKRKVKYLKECSSELTVIKEIIEKYGNRDKVSTIDFKDFISDICDASKRPVVLLLDEVDNAGNYPAFITFLGMLREMYLERRELPAFQSVVLASVYDIKNLKLKICPEDQQRYNSPWNIAADFYIDMSFSAEDIKTMLQEYIQERQIEMEMDLIAELLYEYTAGYPYLVCKLCKIMDEILADWSRDGFLEAVKILLLESNTLFDDMQKKLSEYGRLRIMLYDILYKGKNVAYHQYEHAMNIASMFDFIINDNGRVAVSNRIFETWLYNLFISEEQMKSLIYEEGSKDKSQFIQNGILDMKKVMERFVEHFTEIYGDRDEKFIESEGRKYFLLYLKPIINGMGSYYIEARTRNERRTDIIVNYSGKQYIIELKIWRGKAYNEQGEKQLAGYLNDYHAATGYMLIFNFNQKKEVGVREITVEGKTIIEAVV